MFFIDANAPSPCSAAGSTFEGRSNRLAAGGWRLIAFKLNI
ncbi:hypothetical protein [Imhoffiella purpurea]|uniref:Uncharacterized protein n=1 Tax=Imhoffiella purpurea TaxID=1249627 RepID=W9VE96_9GAMM|nr:hypothetical protein [Imhoffiella purpurea]EXJ14342.1 hypothetical protein D779_2743 [Imhoffiella purpurea]